MRKTLDELNKLYSFDVQDLIDALPYQHPIYRKHADATFEIETVYGLQQNDEISLGKARELTAAIIEKFTTQKPSVQIDGYRIIENHGKFWIQKAIQCRYFSWRKFKLVPYSYKHWFYIDSEGHKAIKMYQGGTNAAVYNSITLANQKVHQFKKGKVIHNI